MGAKQSNVPTGTKWSDIQKDRKKYGDVDIPDIPYNKMKEVCAEIDMTVKQSKFLVEYKREVRDALKRKKAKGHTPKLFRIYDKCIHPANEAAGKGETKNDMVKMLQEGITPVVKDDIIDGFKEEGKTGSLDREADRVIVQLILERVNDKIHEAAEGVFKKDARGENADESDPELDEEAQAKLEEERAERKRFAAKQKEAEAAAWLAEMDGDSGKAAAVAAEQAKRAEDSGEEDVGGDDDE
eukprot:TRINITY_DN14866_c0_g1_i1.p1 TRINITY_DN14866_c0_g1~~TRINITY_DN14866_c0_g1_i1.p1  ORF type:complete len:241 (+),score=130.46 TRINITY_DN14866_c0_g1_i1:101-823(+)